MSRSNFTPMERFREIISAHGLRMMEIGTNHIRVFKDGKKLFDYYPLRMKLFDYHIWRQLTYPFPGNDGTAWENELEDIIKEKTDAPQDKAVIEIGTLIYEERSYPVREITEDNGNVFRVSVEKLEDELLDGIRNCNGEAIELDESICYYCTEEQIKGMSDAEIIEMIYG